MLQDADLRVKEKMLGNESKEGNNMVRGGVKSYGQSLDRAFLLL